MVLNEVRQRMRETKERGHGRDKLVAMETKCEQLEEKLADARLEMVVCLVGG